MFKKIRALRLGYPSRLSQRALADKMQLIGIDIVLKAFSEIFGVNVDRLI